MNKQQDVVFLFTIAKEIKRSFESPVILVTMKDYAGCIFMFLVEMHNALLEYASSERILDIINSFHLEWLQAVQDIDNFKKRVKTIPREVIHEAIEYTNESVKKRAKYFHKVIEQVQTTMTAEESSLMHADLSDMLDMHDTLYSVLQDKQKCLNTLADQTEFCAKLSDEIEELMNWLDKLYDNLAVEFSKFVGIKCPKFLSKLVMTLNEIVDQVAESPDVEIQKIVTEITSKRQTLTNMCCLNINDELEMRKLMEKINTLENRINRLKSENSSAVMALQHKTFYLEERLQSLENLKISLFTLKNKQRQDSCTGIKDQFPFQEYHIFDHLLPAQNRRRLVEQLVRLWDNAVRDIKKRKSIISILSVADIKETFFDELGEFTVDKYGRKLYKTEDDDNWYQLNENNELVAIKDDDIHVYFYDDCGRYYLDKDQQRVYKAHANANDYVIIRDGVMLKLKETHQGVEYWYDDLGRYYEDVSGKRIYCEPNSNDKYEHDGLGNLVRFRSESGIFQPCPAEPVVTDESKYLQRTVGIALKKCLAKLILHQPTDPILYLADSLEKYRFDIQMKQQLHQDKIEMMAERQRRMESPVATASSHNTLGDEETTTITDDYNFINYLHTHA